MANINRVTISGNLTKDPELRQLPSGNSVCKLRMAVNTLPRAWPTPTALCRFTKAALRVACA